MTPEEMKECVHRGMEFLTLHFPGWLDDIDVNGLKVESCRWCPLSQASGKDYFEALADLNIRNKTEPLAGTFGSLAFVTKKEIDLGFYLDGEDEQEVNEIWKQEITKMRMDKCKSLINSEVNG